MDLAPVGIVSQLQNTNYTLGNVFLTTFFTTLGMEGLRAIVGQDEERFQLRSDPQCGLTTGGREECWWDCQTESHEEAFKPGIYTAYITNPSCLEDCFPPDHCLNYLLADYKAAGGVCRGSYLDVLHPGLYNTSNKECILYEEDDVYYQYIKSGLCSEKTRELLLDQEHCIAPLFSQKSSIFKTVEHFILSICKIDIHSNFFPTCDWDCQIVPRENPFNPGISDEFITNPSCLEDCFTPNHCLSSLLADYKAAGGVCRGSFLDVFYPGLYNTSNQECTFHEPINFYKLEDIKSGLCSEKTRELLLDQEYCIMPMWRKKPSIFNTVDSIIRSTCKIDSYAHFFPTCNWDCQIEELESPYESGVPLEFIANPSCLEDCYPPDHCLNSLLADYKAAGGVCRGSWLDVFYPGFYRTSNKECILHEEDDVYNTWDIKSGLCTKKTRKLLLDQENCIAPLHSHSNDQGGSIINTVYIIILSICKIDVWDNFYPGDGRIKKKNRKVKKNRRNKMKRAKNKVERTKALLRRRQPDHHRLTPISAVEKNGGENGVTRFGVPPLDNTLHRYPWLCSLKGINPSSHYCGVTLLARPPGPTVLVTSAHCTFICKSQEGNIVPNCCCPNVGPDTCTESQDCGTGPETKEMTGDDVEVVCGEWDTATNTEEEYNVVLPIEEIIIHPDFQISRGEQNSQFVADDIAVIKVRDENFESLSATNNIYPACLPSNQLTSSTAVHSGWSKPPPLKYVADNVPVYLPVYHHFSKQWHHSMNISTCRDPVTEVFSGTPYKFPSNSYYPPGTICATEIDGDFCPTSGESGSPLMVRDQEERYVAAGIKSFIKGCSQFFFREVNPSFSQLQQSSENPAVYTRLSCYLPWVAAQYNMDYSPTGDPHPDCLTGHGNITEVTAEVCRSISTFSTWDGRDGIEAECLFPFTLNGVTHDSCIMDELAEFTRPLFRCPIRTVKGAGPDGTDYTDTHITGGGGNLGFFCPTNSISASINESGHAVIEFNSEGPVLGPNGQLELDPDLECIGLRTRPVFSTCKNNCPGVNFPVVSGGFALLAASGAVSQVVAAGGLGAAGLAGLAPVLGGLGLVATGAGLMAMSDCSAPLCIATNGQCCLLRATTRGIICPDSC